jgi:pSer/pThr/pTyr-binding forkhead associated (FHA) protein
VHIEYGWRGFGSDPTEKPAPQLRLVLHGEHQVDVSFAERNIVVLGRDRSMCDIAFADGRISRRHCALVRSGGDIAVRDLGSTTGTYLNGIRVETDTPVSNGDSLRIGRTELTVEIQSN